MEMSTLICEHCGKEFYKLSRIVKYNLKRFPVRFCSVSCSSKRHGESRTPLYRRWSGMLSRCNNPKDDRYINYGARGITVCEEWYKYENFRKDMNDSFATGLQLDRIDNNKGYSKENCRWVTISVNNQNRRKKPFTSSKYWGVGFSNYSKKWLATIAKDGVLHRRSFDNEYEAALCYDSMALQYYGECAQLNFPNKKTA